MRVLEVFYENKIFWKWEGIKHWVEKIDCGSQNGKVAPKIRLHAIGMNSAT